MTGTDTEEKALVKRGESLPAAVAHEASAAQAEIQAAYVMAFQRRRNLDDARVAILATCKRPSFANDKSVLYLKPVGGGAKVEGPGIRLAEELARQMGNLRTTCELRHDDAEKQVFAVSATDLETNTSFALAVTVKRTVERHKVRTGQEVVGQRQTSKGQTVYIVRTTDEEMLTKANAAISKALRNCILRCVPQDIVEDAISAIKGTREDRAAKDPAEARKQMADAFGALNIRPSQLEEYLGCRLEEASPAQITDLRSVYGAIRDGEATWRDYVGQESADVERGALSMDDLKAPAETESGGEAATRGPETGQSQAKEEGQAPTTETLSQGTEEAPAAPPAASPAEEEEPPPPHVPSLVEQLEAMGVNGKVFPPVRQLVAEGVVETVEDLRDWLATMPKEEALQVQKMGEGTYGMLLEALDVMEPPAAEPEPEALAGDSTEPQTQRQQELGETPAEDAPAEGEEKPPFEMEFIKPPDQKMSAKETWVSIAHISNAEGKTFTLWMHTATDELGCGCPQNKESGDCEHVQFARNRIKNAEIVPV